MPKLDAAFTDELMDRLEQLPADREPLWGRMQAGELVPHLIASIRSSMGQSPVPEFIGNWFTTTILPPVVYATGILPPKNIKTLDKDGNEAEAIKVDGTLDDLRDALDEFIAGVEAGTVTSPAHPLFGNIEPEGWSKIHRVHFRHHLKQFQL